MIDGVDYLSLSTPFGPMTLFAEDCAIVAFEWGRVDGGHGTPLLRRAKEQLDQYFDGRRQTFDLPLKPAGSAFQQAVWTAMTRIPYGRTRTYGELAQTLKSAARAVGGACGRNPIPIIVPCHRVVGRGGRLGGYSGQGGLETKRALLRLEGWAG